MDHEQLHRRARERGVNRLVLFVFRMTLTPFFLVYLRMQRIGREYIPAEGPVILASNHRSFFDPFIIGTMTRRPVYYVAKKELFAYSRVVRWLLSALGAFPVVRGAGDQDTIDTAKVILERGEPGRARSASRGGVSDGSRSRAGRWSCPSRSSAPMTFAGGGGSGRGRSGSAPDARSDSPRWKAPRRRSPGPSPTGSGRW